MRGFHILVLCAQHLFPHSGKDRSEDVLIWRTILPCFCLVDIVILGKQHYCQQRFRLVVIQISSFSCSSPFWLFWSLCKCSVQSHHYAMDLKTIDTDCCGEARIETCIAIIFWFWWWCRSFSQIDTPRLNLHVVTRKTLEFETCVEIRDSFWNVSVRTPNLLPQKIQLFHSLLFVSGSTCLCCHHDVFNTIELKSIQLHAS